MVETAPSPHDTQRPESPFLLSFVCFFFLAAFSFCWNPFRAGECLSVCPEVERGGKSPDPDSDVLRVLLWRLVHTR